MRLLILSDWFFPARKAGGPVQSIKNLIKYISGDIKILVYCGAYDLNDSNILEHIETNTILIESQFDIYYDSSRYFVPYKLLKIISEFKPDCIYLNSVFSSRYCIGALLLFHFKGFTQRIILAPRGMLKPSALKIKRLKKSSFLFVARKIGLFNNVMWHATNVVEKNEITYNFRNAQVFIANNLPPAISDIPKLKIKIINELEIIFVGRLHPIKNLHFALELFRNFKQKIKYCIIGALEDIKYRAQCESIISDLSNNISVEWIGIQSPEQIQFYIENCHLLLLPTLGENFGHSIIEVLAAGRPVLISNQTPWKSIKQHNAGWELSLSDKKSWIDAIEEAASWDQAAFDRHCQGALDYARAHTNVEELVEKYREMFGG